MNNIIKRMLDLSKYSSLSEPTNRSIDYLNSQTAIPLNTKLNFEQRVLNPGKYPGLKLANGDIASHLMAYNDMTDANGNPYYIAYPNVIQQGDHLVQLDPRDAIRYALENNEYRRFNTPEEAQYYTNYYKDRFWGKGDGTTMKDFTTRIRGTK